MMNTTVINHVHEAFIRVTETMAVIPSSPPKSGCPPLSPVVPKYRVQVANTDSLPSPGLPDDRETRLREPVTSELEGEGRREFTEERATEPRESPEGNCHLKDKAVVNVAPPSSS